MKNKFYLLPIIMLTLTACGKSGEEGGQDNGPHGGVPGSVPEAVEQAIEEITKSDEYKLHFTVHESSNNAHVFGGLQGSVSYVADGEMFVKGKNFGERMSDTSVVSTSVISLSEAMKSMGVTTVAELKVFVQQVYGDMATIDESKGLITIVNTEYSDDPVVNYMMYDEAAGQYKQQAVFNGKQLSACWEAHEDFNETLDYARNVIDMLSANKDKVVEKNGKYELDISDNPFYPSPYYTVNKVTLVKGQDYYISGFEGIMYDGSVMDYEMKYYDFGNCGATFTDFAVPCPFDHGSETPYRYVRHDKDTHAKVCAYCDKYLEKNISHTHHNELGFCVVCEAGPEDFVFDNSKGGLLSNGQPIIENVKKDSAGRLFSGWANSEYDLRYYASKDDTTLYYYASDDVLVFAQSGERTPVGENACGYMYPKTFTIVNGVSVSDEVIEEAKDSSTATAQALGINQEQPISVYKQSLIDAGKPVKSFTTYEIYSSHEETDKATLTRGCTTYEYRTCSKCGETDYVVEYHDHHCTYTKIQPEWGEPGYTYFAVTPCEDCQDVYYQVIGASYISQYDDAHTSWGYYTSDGKQIGNYSSHPSYLRVPHTDGDGDHLCDFCGKVME